MTIKATVTVMLEVSIDDFAGSSSEYTVKQLYEEAERKAIAMVKHAAATGTGRIKLVGTPKIEAVITTKE